VKSGTPVAALRQGLGLDPAAGVVAVDGKSLRRGYERGRRHMPPLSGALLATGLPVYPRLAEPNSSPATIFIDELNPASLERLLHLCTCFIRYTRPKPTFQTLDGRKRKPGSRREFGLRPP
jgi:hypothetical protein